MDDDNDDKDDSKRKSRNLSEKKRRDQFNMLVNELSSIVSANNRKMDKSTVLKSTIAFLKNHNEISVRSRAHEIQENWKPSFLSNEEFTHLILEALDGFVIVFSSGGKVYYVSEGITSLLGYLPNDLLNSSIYDIVYEEDQTILYNILLNPNCIVDPMQSGIARENYVIFSCHMKRGGVDSTQKISFEPVQLIGYFRMEADLERASTPKYSGTYSGDTDTRMIFVGIGRLQTPQLIREMSLSDTKSEFTSRHSLEWKFLFLDHRAPPIIGYLPFEVLGTSGYDYYHFDDLEKMVSCHEALMQKGEGTSCYYRFLTKGQQWIWLQTRFYITYHQWNSKPEFVVCTHRVISYSDVIKQHRNPNTEEKENEDLDASSSERKHNITTSVTGLSPWSKSSRASKFVSNPSSPKPVRYRHYRGGGGGNISDSTSVSADSPSSRYSVLSHMSSQRIRNRQSNQALRASNQSYHNNIGQMQQVSQTPYYPNPIGTMPAIAPQIIPHHSRQPPHQIMTPTSFIESAQYVAAIPVQPVIAPAFTGPTIIQQIPQPSMDYLHPNVVLSSAQSQIQDQLQRKHEELQHLIQQQQEELRRVSEQLMMARYGMVPSVVNVTMSFPADANACENRYITSQSLVQQQQQQEHQNTPNHMPQICPQPPQPPDQIHQHLGSSQPPDSSNTEIQSSQEYTPLDANHPGSMQPQQSQIEIGPGPSNEVMTFQINPQPPQQQQQQTIFPTGNNISSPSGTNNQQ